MIEHHQEQDQTSQEREQDRQAARRNRRAAAARRYRARIRGNRAPVRKPVVRRTPIRDPLLDRLAGPDLDIDELLRIADQVLGRLAAGQKKNNTGRTGLGRWG